MYIQSNFAPNFHAERQDMMSYSYLMENIEEAARLEIKTDPDAVRGQARWCGLKPGIRVLDAGCGPGMVTAILHDMIQPEGSILGLDYSEERILHARENYGEKNGIYIINLQTSIEMFKTALNFLIETVSSGKEALIVGTKKQAQSIITEISEECGMHYVNKRWLGGLLTNFSIVKKSIEKLLDLDEMKRDGRWEVKSKIRRIGHLR